MDDLFLSKIEELKDKKLAIATITKTFGSTLGKAGFKMIISESGEIVYGTLGGGCPEGPIVRIGLDVIKNQQPRVVRIFLEDAKTALGKISISDEGDEIHVETNCGGNMEIMVEPYSPRPTLVVFGDTFNSPLERNVVNVGKEIGFKTIEHNPLGACGQPELATTSLDIESIRIPDGAYVVLVTRGVNDAPLLKHLSKFRLNYVGVVASKNRWEATKQELGRIGVSKEFTERVHAPAGLDINSILLEEIAISIIAEIIEVRRRSADEDEKRLRERGERIAQSKMKTAELASR
ncbi:MAG TPA: XdhC family protein [Nitrososphaerales archaeon]|nr:XdhC family protein [Nitrososphaerales archaeon]